MSYFGSFRVREPVKQELKRTRRKVRKQRMSPKENKQAIVDFIAEAGKVRSRTRIAKALGYNGTSGSLGKYILELVKEGRIVNTGTMHHPVYSLPAASSSSDLTDAQKRVFSYIEKHPGVVLPWNTLAREAGVPTGSLSYYLTTLWKKGYIDTDKGGIYHPKKHLVPIAPRFKEKPLVERLTVTEIPSEDSDPPIVPKKAVEESNEQALLALLDPIAWDFVKSTKNTDLLSFLEWLGRK